MINGIDTKINKIYPVYSVLFYAEIHGMARRDRRDK